MVNYVLQLPEHFLTRILPSSPSCFKKWRGVRSARPGQDYAALRPAISICLLSQILFSQTPVPHHRFRLVDPEHGCELPGAIEVHTVELSKYSLDEETIREATPIEPWSFFLSASGSLRSGAAAGIATGRRVSRSDLDRRDHRGQNKGSTYVRPARKGTA